MQKNNEISVALTTYNGEKYIRDQIVSIEEQSLVPYEIIICDDNSSDETVHIIMQLQEIYSNIKLYKNEVQLGLNGNFEQAISLCCGNYIALSDQDDIWLKDKLKIELQLLQAHEKEGEPILVHSDLEMIDENKGRLHDSFFTYRGISYPDSKGLSRVISHNGVMGNTILMNRDLVELALPFPERLQYHDYWLPIISEIYGQRITCEKALVQYRIHEHNSSNSRASLHKGKKSKLTLPFCNQNKEYVLQYLLNSYEVDPKDRKIIEAFIMYLENSGYWFMQIYNMERYNLIRKERRYRMGLYSKIFLRSLFKGFS